MPDDTEPDDPDRMTTEELPPGLGGRLPLRGPVAGKRYRLGAQIGLGGMGEVVSADDQQIGRDVAIKRLRDKTPTEGQLRRFEREARIQGRLDHPAIVPVYELGRDDDGLPFFAMKKLAGTTLDAILKGKPGAFTRERLLRAFTDVCLAIEFAHVKGVIHRDLKPSNIVLGDFGEVYVLDWGVAKVVGESEDFEDIRSERVGTRAGAIVGTPGYMSPEQERGEAAIDARADVYMLGRVLEDILDGFGAPPPELVALVEQSLEEQVTQRIQTARELAERVQRYLDGDRDIALRTRLAGEHFARARTAFENRDAEEARATAMREAGAALALDPRLAGAAELIGRLMIEPPRTTPREVEAAVRHDKQEGLRQTSRSGLYGQAAYLVLVPCLLSVGSVGFAIALGTLVPFMAYLAWRAWRHAQFTPPIITVLGHAAIIVTLGRLFSPLVIAPAVATVVALILSQNPGVQPRAMAISIGSVIALAVVGPQLAELAGLIPATTDISSAGIVLHAPGLASGAMYVYFAGMFYVPVILVFVIAAGRRWRTSDYEQRRQLHLQAWQVRQLVAAGDIVGR